MLENSTAGRNGQKGDKGDLMKKKLGTILVIGDEAGPGELERLRDSLGESYEILVAASDAEAVALLRERGQPGAAAEPAQASSQMLLDQGRMAALGSLAAGLSHELNNPVAFVQSNLGSLSRYVDKITKYTAFVESEGIVLESADPAQVQAFARR